MDGLLTLCHTARSLQSSQSVVSLYSSKYIAKRKTKNWALRYNDHFLSFYAVMHDGNFGFSLTSATVLVHVMVSLWVAVLALHFEKYITLRRYSDYVMSVVIFRELWLDSFTFCL